MDSALAASSAAEPGSRAVTNMQNGVAETWTQTVDPRVPESMHSTDYRGPRREIQDLDETGALLWNVSHPLGIMNSVALSNDGSVVAIAVYLNNAQLQVYNGQTGNLIYSKAGTQSIWDDYVAMSASGQSIAYSTERLLYLMTATDSIPVWTATIDTISFGPVGISPDGNRIIVTQRYSSTSLDSLHVWCFAASGPTPVWSHAYPLTVGGWYGVNFSGDDTRAAVTANNRIYVYDPANGNPIWDIDAFNTQYPAKLSYDGKVLTTGSNTGLFRVFGWDEGQQTYTQLWRYTFTGGTSNWATASAVSGDGMTVACGSYQVNGADLGFVAVFDTYGTGTPLWLSPAMSDVVSDVEVSYDGLTIAASSWGSLSGGTPNIDVFDKNSPTPFYTYTHVGSPNDLAMNPAGTRLIGGGKAVHNRMFGNGGHAYYFSLDLEGGAVSGTVTLNQQTDYSGVTVEAVGANRSAITDAAGTYHIEHIPAGTYTISAHKLGYTTEPTTGIVVTDGGNTQNVNFALDTVGVAPSNLSASQGQIRSIHLAWNAMTDFGHRVHARDIRFALGEENPPAPRGPLAAAAQATLQMPEAPWSGARHHPLDDLDEPDSVRIWRSTVQGGPYLPIATIDGNAVAYDDSAHVFPTFNYYYVLTALYANVESAYSNEASGSVDDSYLQYSVVVPPMSHAVTFDGVLSPQEWSDAIRVDASDVFGYDAPNPPQSVYLYMKYDDTNDLLLIAAEDHNQNTLDDNDGFGIYVDDDNNDAWSYNRPGSEGNYWAYYYNSGPTLRYRSLSGEPYASTPYQFPNPQIGFSVASGYFSGEVAIPMGFHQPYQIALYGPNRTPGIGFFVTDRANGGVSFDGWWPQNMPSIVSNPNYFADCSIQATLYVPPVPPSNVAVQNSDEFLHVTWTDPATGIDSMGLHQPLAGIHVYRNGDFLATVAAGVQSYMDATVISGGWYGYKVTGFVMEETSAYDGPLSSEAGAYAGSVPPAISILQQDDGTWERFFYVTYPDSNNRMAEQFDIPPEHSKVYTIQVVTEGTHSFNLGIAADDGGVPGAYVAGPYTVTTPVADQLWTFHIPGLEQPAMTGSFWVSLDWDHASPLDPYIASDFDGPSYGHSWSYTINRGWFRTETSPGVYANWMIRAGVGGEGEGVGDQGSPVVHQFRLMSNYPNPFNPSTTIPFELSEHGNASLTVYNLMGQKVATLLSGTQQAGYHVVQWNGRSELGNSVASGLYLVRLEAGTHVATQKIALIR
jgi:hypothetical protein